MAFGCPLRRFRRRRRLSQLLELLDAIRERFAGEVDAGPRHLHECELERQPRVAALSHVFDGDRQQVDEPDDSRLAELIRLCAKPLARLLRHRQRRRNFAHVLNEHQVPQMLEQVRDEAAEILSLFRELLDEREGTRSVAVDDEIAEAEQRLFLHGAEQLQHRLHGHLAFGRS